MKRLVALCLLLSGLTFLSGCGQSSDSQSQSNSQTSPVSAEKDTQNEEARLKALAENGELIEISEQDKKDIADWVAQYKEPQNTAFEKIDINWNYADPAETWFAQKELGFNTVTDPPVDLKKLSEDIKDKEGYVSNAGFASNINLFKKTDYTEKQPEINISTKEFTKLFSAHISNLNKFINIINQYYPSRVPKSELTNPQQKGNYTMFSSKMNHAADVSLAKVAPLISGKPVHWAYEGTGGSAIIRRIGAIVAKGDSNIVYEIVPPTQEEDKTSYFSESKYYGDDFYKKTVVAGQVVIKATTFEKADENHIRKTVSYLDLLNKTGSKSYPFLSGGEIKPELLYYGDNGNGLTGNVISITYQKDNPK